MMQPDDDQPYLPDDMYHPDPRQGHNDYYSPPQRHSKKANSELRPLSCNNEYMATTTIPRNCCSGKSSEEQGSCAVCARVFVCIAGICNTLAGLFLVLVALGVLEREFKSKLLVGFSGFAATFAVVLCSIILIIAACNHTKPRFKAALAVFSVLLIIVSLLEIAAVGFTLWSHSVVANPANKDGTTAARLLSWSNRMANTTYLECCVAFTPPYSGANATAVDGICQWPESTLFIKDACADTNVLVCVCQKGLERYESLFGLFLRQSLTWTATALFVSAVMNVGILVSICTLMRPENQMVSEEKQLKREPIDLDLDESIYAN